MRNAFLKHLALPDTGSNAVAPPLNAARSLELIPVDKQFYKDAYYYGMRIKLHVGPRENVLKVTLTCEQTGRTDTMHHGGDSDITRSDIEKHLTRRDFIRAPLMDLLVDICKQLRECYIRQFAALGFVSS